MSQNITIDPDENDSLTISPCTTPRRLSPISSSSNHNEGMQQSQILQPPKRCHVTRRTEIVIRRAPDGALASFLLGVVCGGTVAYALTYKKL